MNWWEDAAFRIMPECQSTVMVDGKPRVVRMWIKAGEHNLDWNYKIVFMDGGEITW